MGDYVQILTTVGSEAEAERISAVLVEGRLAACGSNRYIKKSATGGGWDVVKEGHRRATAHAATKKDAIDAARKMIRREGGGASSHESLRKDRGRRHGPS